MVVCMCASLIIFFFRFSFLFVLLCRDLTLIWTCGCRSSSLFSLFLCLFMGCNCFFNPHESVSTYLD